MADSTTRRPTWMARWSGHTNRRPARVGGNRTRRSAGRAAGSRRRCISAPRAAASRWHSSSPGASATSRCTWTRCSPRGWVRRGGPGRPRSRPACCVDDRGYSYPTVRRLLARRGIRAVIPRRRDQRPGDRRHRPLDRPTYRERNRVERLVNRLKQYRRIATRYDKRAAHFLGMLTLACVLLWLSCALHEPAGPSGRPSASTTHSEPLRSVPVWLPPSGGRLSAATVPMTPPTDTPFVPRLSRWLR